MIIPPKKLFFFRLVKASGLLTDSLQVAIMIIFSLPLRSYGPDSIPGSEKFP